jgi:hypothetical protein
MKKGLSIFLVLIMVISTMHFFVATHYCGGRLAASEVSLTGKLAGCGMEESGKELPSHGLILLKHCCDDKLTSVYIDNNYAPSVSIIHYFFQHSVLNLYLTAGFPVHPSPALRSVNKSMGPPGPLISTNVDLSEICIFRI